MIGHGYLPRGDAEALIASEAREVRKTQSRLCVAIESFDGYRPNGGAAISVPKGARLEADDPIVAKYSARFRPLAGHEIERAVASWIRRRRVAAGL
jgi:hypothetical protein